MKLPELWKEDVFWKYVLESTTDPHIWTKS